MRKNDLTEEIYLLIWHCFGERAHHHDSSFIYISIILEIPTNLKISCYLNLTALIHGYYHVIEIAFCDWLS